MTARGWVWAGVVFVLCGIYYTGCMAGMVFVLQTTRPAILLVSCLIKAMLCMVLSFGASVIGIFGQFLGEIPELVEES